MGTSSGPPAVNLSCVNLSEADNGSVNVTVSWTLIGGDNADYYLINITCTNAPQLPHGGFVNASVTQYELTGFLSGFDYNIVVRGVTTNCGGLMGTESEPLIITPRGSIKISFNLKLDNCSAVKTVPDHYFITDFRSQGRRKSRLVHTVCSGKIVLELPSNL